MKECPVCHSTYTDDSLVFCLTDGEKLFSPSSTAVTQEMSFGDRKTLPGAGKTFDNFNSAPTVAVRKSGKTLNILILIGVFGFIALLIGGIAVTRYFVLKRNAEREEVLKSGQTPANEQNSEETRKLREKLDSLEKQIERQKTANKNAPPANKTSTPLQNDASVSGKVDSPGDGFLALRSAPNHKTGSQLEEIPHGTVIFVYNCQNTTRVGERRGRWCETTYGGKTGWVFDGFLIY